MTHGLTRRSFLGALGATALQASAAHSAGMTRSLRPMARPAGPAAPQVPDASTLLEQANLSGEVIYAVADAKTGQILEAREVAGGLPPASVTKSVTAAYGLEMLGPAYRFVTRLIATGPVVGGVVKGDLVLTGGGDPTLDTDGMAALAQQLKISGIRAVEGAFLVYGGSLPKVPQIDMGQPDYAGYNPTVSGLNLNFNRVHFEWRRASSGYDLTMDARSEKYRPDISMARMRVADRDLPVFRYEDAGAQDAWSVARGALGGGGARWLPVRKPELYAGEVLQIFARSHGIVLKTPQLSATRPRGSVLARLESAPMMDVMRDCLKYSTNLTAEIVGLSASQKRSGPVSGLEESAARMTDWCNARLSMKAAHFVDHSGLGEASRVTASGLAQAYAGDVHRGLLPSLLKSVPLKDADGNTIRDTRAKVRAKTGTLNFVSGLGGYLTTAGGRELSFAIFAADLPRRATLTDQEKERPAGGAAWNRRAKGVQQALLRRWGLAYNA